MASRSQENPALPAGMQERARPLELLAKATKAVGCPRQSSPVLLPTGSGGAGTRADQSPQAEHSPQTRKSRSRPQSGGRLGAHKEVETPRKQVQYTKYGTGGFNDLKKKKKK